MENMAGMAAMFSTPMGSRVPTPSPAASEPPGATRRSASVRRRLETTGETGLSPKAKRPVAYTQPQPSPVGPPMGTDVLTSELMQTKAAVEQMHLWVTSVVEAVVDHANSLDTMAVEQGVTKGKLAAFERQLTEGMNVAEKKLTDTLSRVDALIAQLRQDSTQTTADLAAKAAQLEAGLASLQSTGPQD